MDIEHTGFCMDSFDLNTCGNCPSLRECLALYGKEQAQKVLEAMPAQPIYKGENDNGN